ncbi:methylated-DNA--[protein]-cysteine S-methyltransferase [Lapidilactobacillus gannanensis]|jgi:methylated-DNA-[protein]-cysteine S-methyltransferase|uniref:Methylated-DNA--protein-cysteine methyltransferase n=1 Tax=Lapidilactobacillus gannanensis TaxID=2486002 RepID=A0ABW4BSC4_9LACO|nr:methylated-DNA--[protein]-cysteine S-methyltransferase [Lapidilactobacillus gannanensis]MCH4057523.1 methylated-DNA--[protein]-cysteine S-methyltransferase [Lactobacillaceae bacterium]
MLLQTTYQSPLGPIILLARDEQLVGLWFAGQKYQGSQYDLSQISTAENQILRQSQIWLDAYFAGQKPAIDQLNLAPEVTPFRQRVLAVLTQIPQGQVLTYGEIAKKMNTGNQQPTSPRAVGGAVGHNPISIIIPCHRVVGSDGSLTGYAGGLDRKIALLAHEGFDQEVLNHGRIN